MGQYKDMTVNAEDVREGDLIDMEGVFSILDGYGWGWEISDSDRYAAQFEYATVEYTAEDFDGGFYIYNDLRDVELDPSARVTVRRPITEEG